jgi:hypothetical protein
MVGKLHVSRCSGVPDMVDELGWAGMRRRIDWWDPCLTEIDGWGRTPTALGSLHGPLEDATSGEPFAPAI